MISQENYLKALGAEAERLSHQEISDLKDRQEKLADMLFDLMFFDNQPTAAVKGQNQANKEK